jgi:ABC-type antimicrobial peptide transport system ATPase subunit
MRPIDPTAPKDRQVIYRSPVGDKTFDRVEVLSTAQVKVAVQTGRYHLEAVVPLKALGIGGPAAGRIIRGDVGVIFSDAQGRSDAARMYWSNPHTNLTSDLPLEAWLYPATWGELTFE